MIEERVFCPHESQASLPRIQPSATASRRSESHPASCRPACLPILMIPLLSVKSNKTIVNLGIALCKGGGRKAV